MAIHTYCVAMNSILIFPMGPAAVLPCIEILFIRAMPLPIMWKPPTKTSVQTCWILECIALVLPLSFCFPSLLSGGQSVYHLKTPLFFLLFFSQAFQTLKHLLSLSEWNLGFSCLIFQLFLLQDKAVGRTFGSMMVSLWLLKTLLDPPITFLFVLFDEIFNCKRMN